MPKAILICGKLASGKSVYCENLRRKERAVVLSVDEITLALFDSQLGDKHEEICARTQQYLFQKSLEVMEAGVNIILDWGFWQKRSRDEARAFYETCCIPCEMHYIDVPKEIWKKNIEKRNRAVADGTTAAYPIDAELIGKLERLFEAPTRDEIDVWVVNDWR